MYVSLFTGKLKTLKTRTWQGPTRKDKDEDKDWTHKEKDKDQAFKDKLG